MENFFEVMHRAVCSIDILEDYLHVQTTWLAFFLAKDMCRSTW